VAIFSTDFCIGLARKREFEDWHFLKVIPFFFALILLHDAVVNPESVAHLKRFVAANLDRRL
jgi:nitrogen fixation protein FixH